MSAMILCRTRNVKNPYYAEELGLHLYSGEELSYYIYNNALLIGDNFIEERLFRFIGQELGMEGLESKLRRWASQADLTELLLVILQDIHYYDSEEVAEFRKTLEGLDKLSAGEKTKMRGEYLIRRHRYTAAIAQYDRLLGSNCPELEDAEFRSKILLARGVCCARQFQWQDAADCLLDSWKLQPSENTARMLYQITCEDSRVAVCTDPFLSIDPELLAQWKTEFEETKSQARYSGKGRTVSELLGKDIVRRRIGLRDLTEEWKKEYRQNQGG